MSKYHTAKHGGNICHTHELKRPMGESSSFHVVTDGLVMSHHRTVQAARNAASKNPHHTVYANTPFGLAFVAKGDEWKWKK